nr:acyl-activating enzyme 8 [Pogostemon cablin]
MHPLTFSHSISSINPSSLSGFKENSPLLKPPKLQLQFKYKKDSPWLFLCNSSNNSSLSLSPHTGDKLPPPPANSTPLTPIDFLERAAIVYGDCPSILHNNTTAPTWSETYSRCLKLASAISSLGISRGDVVSIVAPNVPAMYELQFAVPMAGAVLNNINLRLDANPISILLQHSSSKLVFVDIQSVSDVLEAVSLFPPHLQPPILVVMRDEGCEIQTPSLDCDQYLDYEKMVESGDPGFKWIRPESEWDPISLCYTSGTTSSAKGVLHSHRGAFMMSLISLLDWQLPRQAVYLWTLPIFHANGWSYAWGTAAMGCANVCLRRVDAPSIYEAITNYKVTHMCGAPVVLNMLTNHPGRKPLEAPVHIMTAGAPPPAAILGGAESQGFVVSHGYGLTETGGLVVSCAWKQEWENLSAPERAKMKARQGVRTVGFTEADVVDPDSGERVARDGSTVGEVVLRGGSVMIGYLKDPEGTAKSMRGDGWFYTGDVGVVHPDGYLEVKDRSKDIIICGGENVSSVEVEEVLYSHPAVNEAAVVARADVYWGETACAFVSVKEDAAEKPTEKEIREYCKATLPLYMVPRLVVFKDDLPKTSTGKLQKSLLREMAKHLG